MFQFGRVAAFCILCSLYLLTTGCKRVIDLNIINRFNTAIVIETETGNVLGEVPANTTSVLPQRIVRLAGGDYVLRVRNKQGKLLAEIRKDSESVNTRLQNHTWNLEVP